MYRVRVLQSCFWDAHPGLDDGNVALDHGGATDHDGEFLDHLKLMNLKSSLDSTVVALKVGEPILKLRQPGEAEWSIHRYANEDWFITDMREVEGMLFALTSQGTVAKVEIETVEFMFPWKVKVPTVTVTELDGQQYYQPSTRMTHHFVDVETPETIVVVEISSIDRRDIMEIKSAW
ncbi:hypothetical protein COCNU_02G017510 [Cocos nucifera]|uniref:Uncharacterized protein n=1 Tax=Cocos nucifera TaxID=13894 RepID=A0A8K0I1K1_COCNU|nr:hypothetical protein COCNU_02G017510 [Cocos nucifera]